MIVENKKSVEKLSSPQIKYKKSNDFIKIGVIQDTGYLYFALINYV